ncbi:hypothetical protein [Rurimicrobium arvi]|uniref:hypothetical protein n=1 Tax=Rurimicrobium arvi TaxID=2049916 RepID=UPI0031D8D6B5
MFTSENLRNAAWFSLFYLVFCAVVYHFVFWTVIDVDAFPLMSVTDVYKNATKPFLIGVFYFILYTIILFIFGKGGGIYQVLSKPMHKPIFEKPWENTLAKIFVRLFLFLSVIGFLTYIESPSYAYESFGAPSNFSPAIVYFVCFSAVTIFSQNFPSLVKDQRRFYLFTFLLCLPGQTATTALSDAYDVYLNLDVLYVETATLPKTVRMTSKSRFLKVITFSEGLAFLSTFDNSNFVLVRLEELNCQVFRKYKAPHSRFTSKDTLSKQKPLL